MSRKLDPITMYMRPFVWCLVLLSCLSGCGGCDDESGSTTQNQNNEDLRDQMDISLPQTCKDSDGDGFSVGLGCDANLTQDCNDTNPGISPLATESCDDNIDNNCDGEVNEGCRECEEGATRECSSDIGACQAGIEECVDGFWSTCSGTLPSSESCDGVDNDCDGDIDEDPEILCDDGLICNGAETCEQGACVAAEGPDCSAFDSACSEGVCDEKEGGCRARFLPDDTACDDGLFCTEDSVCLEGVCQTTPRDCSSADDQCNIGVCDEATDACVPQPVSDGTMCDDGAFCTTGDVCTSGTCGGSARDCSGESDQCTVGICDESAGACVAQPVVDDTPCDDNLYCTTGEVCTAGACGGGQPRVCGAAGGSCRTGVCDEAAKACTGDPLPDGTSCDDGLFCTSGDTCSAGTCMGGGATDCSGSGDQCNTGTCDENLNRCAPRPVADSTPCDDGLFCTNGDTCQAGACAAGPARSCPGNACNSGVCDDTQDSCLFQPVSDGTSCDDGLYCTDGDTCQAGSCSSGPARMCPGNACNNGVCDDAQDSCVLEPVADGSSCTDGSYCTQGDTCQAGVCDPGAARVCPGNACNSGVCDDVQDTCVLQPASNGTSCSDGAYCTQGDACQSGTCNPGAARSCPGSQCQQGICDETNNRCDTTPAPDTTPCDDGQFCTSYDTCQSGSCVGAAPVICPGDACNQGICDEASDQCDTNPLPDGTSCEDGLFCTNNDTCQVGSCVAGPTDTCDGMVSMACTIAVCDEIQNTCIENPDPACCNSTVDADLDGVNVCDDCDDNDGSIFPGATERCDGLDNDCDGLIDEDFDLDGDGYGTCSQDPLIRDCDDTQPNDYPGAPELCGAGAGDGRDNDCDGYIDEGCQGCSMADNDGDGISECGGDCNDADPDTYPGAPEICDGEDNDCNQYTRPNCGVSQPCNFDGDGNPANEQDVCQDDMICACELANNGSCTGNYLCTSFCNSSDTGGLGDGCQSNQFCSYDLLYSANIHGCAVTTDPIAAMPKRGGEACNGDAECRSLNCDRICSGPGCNQKYCLDWCSSDDYCAASAVCSLRRTSSQVDGRCQPSSSPLLGASTVGQTCTQDFQCDHGLCATSPNDGQRRCTEACCQDTDCPGGFTCSLGGERVSANVVYGSENAKSCGSNSECAGEGGVCNNGRCVWPIVETSPMCIPDVAGQGSRTAGQACANNNQCASNFCERDLGVCIEVCCSDNDCPMGQTCEKQFVQTDGNNATQARVCVNVYTEEVLRRR